MNHSYYAYSLLLTVMPLHTSFAKDVSKDAVKIREARPNVIFIYGDDLGKGMLSAYGQQIIKTPNIDRVINQGIDFTNAYGCHYSAPARASLLTGYSDCHLGHWIKSRGQLYMQADTTYVSRIEAAEDKEAVVLPKGDDYLADVFNRAGYFTGEIGKLDYGFGGTRSQMKAHGWDHYYGYLDHHRCHGYYPPYLFTDGRIEMIPGNTRDDCGDEEYMEKSYTLDSAQCYKRRWDMEGKVHYSQDIFDKKIIDFLRQHKDEPFFLYHPSQLPHGPVAVPELDPQVKNNSNLTDLEKEYASMVIRLDNTVGKILNELKRLNIDKKTIVIFSADNGHMMYYPHQGTASYKKDIKTHKVFNNSDVRYTSTNAGDKFRGSLDWSGFKRSNLEGGVHIPLAFYWPGHFTPHKETNIVSNYDFLSTMADMLGVSITAQKDGISYLPLLEENGQQLPSNRYIIVDSFEGPAMIMNDGWKLRYNYVTKGYELYNLRHDIKEENDLASQYPEKVKTMRRVMDGEAVYSECRQRAYPYATFRMQKPVIWQKVIANSK